MKKYLLLTLIAFSFHFAALKAQTITCPANTTVAACQSQAAVNTAFANWLSSVSASGGCNGVLTNNNTGAPAACGGSTTVTFTYTSQCAPFTTVCQSVFTVAAPPAIVLTCPASTTASAGQSQAAINTAFANWLSSVSASGGCNGILTNNNTGAPSASGGSTTVTFTYTSDCTTPRTCQAVFAVAAPPAVVLTCPTNTTVARCQSQAAVNTAFSTWLSTVTASGGCNGVLTNNNFGAPSACGGSSTVTFTYTNDCAPTTRTCASVFTVAAPQTVILNCPSNFTASAGQTQSAINTAFSTWLSTVTASGGCNGVLTNNNTGAPSANGGSTTVTFTYTSDCSPTTSSCQAVFTVATPPVVLSCPTNTTVAACQSQAAVNTAFSTWLSTVTASGGCNGVLTNNNTGAPLACGGTAIVRFTYTSSCAPLTTTCQAAFTVTAPPAFTVPANGGSTVACPALAVAPTLPTVVDGCGNALTPTGPVVTNSPNPLITDGTRTYTYSFVDCGGNTASWSFVYTVTSPVFTNTTTSNATVGTAYSLNAGVTGGTQSIVYSVSPALSAGLTINTATGLISGIPTTASGFSTYTVSAMQGICVATQAYSYEVVCPSIAFTNTSLPNRDYNQVYSYTITLTGNNSVLSYSLTSGTLPSGFALSSTGVISGTSTAVGIFNFGLSATNAYGCTVSGNFGIDLNPIPLTVTAIALSKSVGGTDPVLTYTVVPALLSGDSFTGSLTRAVGESAGLYPITQGTLSAGNKYTITFVGANFEIISLASVDVTNSEFGTKVYPTPFSDVVNIRFESVPNSTVFVNIFDISGKEVMSTKPYSINSGSEIVLPLQNLEAGTYMIQIKYADTFKNVRIVKEK